MKGGYGDPHLGHADRFGLHDELRDDQVLGWRGDRRRDPVDPAQAPEPPRSINYNHNVPT
jgi:hypothetical protein